jgi:uncharacterized membrane protein YedE/YeeE
MSWMVAAAGGAMIGTAAASQLLVQGRVAGVSGIVGAVVDGVVAPAGSSRPWFSWRGSFLAGLVFTGIVAASVAPEAVEGPAGRSPLALVVAGLLVGWGTRMGSGCTSGHGVCGTSRPTRRSLTATALFMVTGMVTVTAVRVLAGGAL